MSNKEQRTARIVGALFLIAMAASLVGAALIEPIMAAQDYLINGSTIGTQVTIGVLLELINGIAVIGIAVFMFPIFKKHNEGLALGYVAFRIIEAIIIFAAVVSPLTLLALGQEYLAAGAADTAYFQTMGTAFIAVRTIVYGQMLGIFFSLAALIFYYLLYQARLVPRWLSVWGIIAAVLVLTWNLLEFVGIHVSFGLILALPIILNEILLGIWLIVKGFNSSTAVSEPAKAALV